MFGFLKKKPEIKILTSEIKLREILVKRIPSSALELILELWLKHPFNFTVTRERKSRLGDYIFKNNQHYISVNGSSSQYSFLVTLVHEIAHQHVKEIYGNRRGKVSPHGIEWKNTFKNLMYPFLNSEIFPDQIRPVLIRHMQNPAASSTRDPALMRVLGIESEEYDIEKGIVKLSQIEEGERFVFNRKPYKKLSNRRTRSLVESISDKKQYTIPLHARVHLYIDNE